MTAQSSKIVGDSVDLSRKSKMQQPPPPTSTPENDGSTPGEPVFESSSDGVPDVGQGAQPGEGEIYDEEPVDHVPGSFLAALPQFFVFPLILVGSLTAIYLLLRFVAGFEEPNAREMLERVQQAGGSDRWYQIHNMTQRLETGRLDMAEISVEELERFHGNMLSSLDASTQVSSDEREMLRYTLLLFVAQKGDPHFTPLALEALESDSATVRSGALRALAILRDPESLGALDGYLQAATESSERMEALLAVASLAALPLPASGPARDTLAELIRDSNPDLARNAALRLGLAGDERAVSIIAHLLDREGYGDDGGGIVSVLTGLADEASQAEIINQYVEQMLVFACRAAAALKDPSLVPALQALRSGDPSMKVKSAALDALHDMGVESETS